MIIDPFKTKRSRLYNKLLSFMGFHHESNMEGEPT